MKGASDLRRRINALERQAGGRAMSPMQAAVRGYLDLPDGVDPVPLLGALPSCPLRDGLIRSELSARADRLTD
jgi:hypothetical protein